jgi:alkylation response protein AidB-like acyl-CoA dehydrogenase
MAEVTSPEDQDLLRESIGAAFRRLSRPEDVRAAMATRRGWDDAVWQRLAYELGVPGLMLDPGVGGGGFSAIELGIVLEEAGACLLCAPLLSTAGLAVPLLLASGDVAAIAEYGARIAAGELIATVALTEDDGRWSTAGVATTATETPDGWRLDGVKNYVVDGADAGLILVVARDEQTDLQLFAVAGDAAGLGRESLVTLDQTRKQARLSFHATPARLLCGRAAPAALAQAEATSRALLAAEQAGGAKRCLDLTVEYAKTRLQFGRAIGSFQAVKQRLAEMLVQVESARSAAYTATRAAAQDDPDLQQTAAIAALTCSEAYCWVSAQMIQLHGGIGFTWEHDAHLYFKRARASAQLLGSPRDHVDTLVGLLDAADA